MRCKGKYTSGWFHKWGEWEDKWRTVKSEFLTCASPSSPTSKHTVISSELFNVRTCSRCGKTEGEKVA